jgi:hypothetical protein
MGTLVKGKPRLQTTMGEFANSLRPFLRPTVTAEPALDETATMRA